MRLFKRLLIACVLLAMLVAGAAVWWLQRPLVPADATQALELTVAPGASPRRVAESLANAGAESPATLLFAWFRLSGQARDIKAGSYEFEAGTTPRSLLDKLVRGDQALRSLTLLEGWNIREMMAAVRSSPDLQQDIEGMSLPEIMTLIGYPGRHPEGRFFPDTYRMVKHAPASTVLRQAALAMDQRLAEAWAQRSATTPLRSPDEALILASIVEKETGLESDRAQIAGVFSNRLRIGMRLQTDPTVIYGLGERFDGNLRRIHLQTDTPYNTYTRAGLPPTPIAMPGWNSLLAAVQPQATRALYFVSRGDGSSQFSVTLQEHNAAVQRFILRR
ncbi:endolytic transglycosylase MltG [Hydrogenophaga sp.]|uniref:endolytic transglycosylase MltG n=1 Tax=Hydrogenophaga sp. TaxID=1904254 RepID=UPI002639E230|nr:endolytic transglycosylase MltG [Hydrogenophaga sp.]MDM7950640.1 endolytic transglycosylase MltG [Hydrogenophaga sp.]